MLLALLLLTLIAGDSGGLSRVESANAGPTTELEN